MPSAVAAFRLLLLTGCRLSEIQFLRWEYVKDDYIELPDSKTGPRAVPLGKAARAHIDALPGARDPDAFLFPRYADGRGAYSLVSCWRSVCADAGLGRLRLHDLRHTTASQAVMSGENLPLVGKLLGHRRHRTTAGYAHLADRHLVEAAERIGAIIIEMMRLDGSQASAELLIPKARKIRVASLTNVNTSAQSRGRLCASVFRTGCNRRSDTAISFGSPKIA